MESPGVNSFTVDPRLTLIFALLIALILGGNGLLVWQFQIARLQTERVTSGNRQVVAVLRLQETLLSFHQRLDELVQSKDPHRVLTEAEPLRKTLVEQIEQTRNTLTHLPPETRVDPAFLPTLDAIEIDLPSQVENVTGLATSGGWDVARIRLADGLKFQENQVAALVKTIDRESNEELASAIASMRRVQQRILFIVPITAISTVFVAAFFGWAIARRILEVRLEERVRERTRIARDLHDTLLQSFQAVLMQLYAVTYQLRDRPEEAWQMLEKVIEQARQAVIEGRDAVQGLRSSTVVTNDLAQEISTLGEELAAAHRGQNCPEFRMQVEGISRDLAPLVRDDVHQIVSEAMRNAFRHAQAGKIEVEIRYEQRQLRLRVLDNGKGINRKVLAEGGQPGHFGLAGMKERAKLVGGKLAVLSRFNSGTEIEVTIPGSIAYVKSPGVGQSMTARKGT